MKKIYEKVPVRKEKVDNSMILGFSIVFLLMLMVMGITIINDNSNEASIVNSPIVLVDAANAASEETMPFFDSSSNLTAYGQTAFIAFLTDFYNTYGLAINQQNASFLTPFVSVHNLDKFTMQFDEWFVLYKEIESATVSTQIGSVTFKDNNIVEVEILETVHLIHQKQEYRVNLMWTTFVMEEDSQLKIADRVLTDSLVSYEDDGKWIKY
ncbi:MAG: hypothetical protein BEN18_10930 [Epulopiscium sp. Nuni2H_MBin001]|nr:MAG: hypothetical protein BEN18_10930 [Epulopiscium sp. Nuni2H_MBin001]